MCRLWHPKEWECSKFLIKWWIDEIGTFDKVNLWDTQYYFVSLIGWNRIFWDVLKNMPRYISDKFDCDNYALQLMARVNMKYKLNGCGLVIGEVPNGYHAWNIFVAPIGLYYYEPQTGQVIEIGTENYVGREVFWG